MMAKMGSKGSISITRLTKFNEEQTQTTSNNCLLVGRLFHEILGGKFVSLIEWEENCFNEKKK